MNLDEAKQIAHDVVAGKVLSYEDAAHQLAEYILNLVPGTNVIEITDEEADTIPPEPYEPSPSVIPITIDEDELDP